MHVARSLQRELVPKQYTQGPWQWGTVHAVNASPATVDVYLDGSSSLTPGLRYLSSYVPSVGDVVFVARGTGGLNTDRVVLGPCADATFPARGNPAAKGNFGAVDLGTSATLIPMSSAFVQGGVTVSSNEFVVPAAGIYRVQTNLQLDNGGSESDFYWGLNIYQNGSQIAGAVRQEGTFGSQYVTQSLSTLLDCALGDTIGFYGSVSAAGGMYINPDARSSYATIELVSQ